MDAHRASGNPWQPAPVMEQLKARRAQRAVEPVPAESKYGAGLSNLEYAPLCEIMGRSPIGAEPFNCSAPDTGNMETLVRYATPEQQKRSGCCRCSTARSARLRDDRARRGLVGRHQHPVAHRARRRPLRDQRPQVVDPGANDPRCRVLIFVGQSTPDHPDVHRRQSMILVPMDTPGVKVLRHLPVFGYDDAPHGHAEVLFENVRVPASNMLLGEGRGFEIAQGRLGPGRIHHCMRVIGRAERALEMMCRRSLKRVAFGRKLSDQGVTRERIAQSRIPDRPARWLVLHAAWKMDTVGNKAARQEIAMIKVAAPSMAGQVIDWAMQLHGGGSVSDDFGLARAYASTRTLRFADGPDEVHRNAIAKLELARYADAA